MELLSAQMVIYPNAIVDHHFDELIVFFFFSRRCVELHIIRLSNVLSFHCDIDFAWKGSRVIAT
jgi:hypothetical protein